MYPGHNGFQNHYSAPSRSIYMGLPRQFAMMPTTMPTWQLPGSAMQPRFDIWSGGDRISDSSCINQFKEEIRQKEIKQRIQEQCKDKLETLHHDEYQKIKDDEDPKTEKVDFDIATIPTGTTNPDLYNEEKKQRELRRKIKSMIEEASSN